MSLGRPSGAVACASHQLPCQEQYYVRREAHETHSTIGFGCVPCGSTPRINHVETKLVNPIYRKTRSGSRSCTRYASCWVWIFAISVCSDIQNIHALGIRDNAYLGIVDGHLHGRLTGCLRMGRLGMIG
jgi:hypothetical protein